MSTATQYICPECQRVLRTPGPLPSGKKIRCPACNTIFAPSLDEPRPASPVRSRTEPDYPRRREEAYDDRPAPRRRPADDYTDDFAPRRAPARRRPDDYDDYDDDRPRRRKKKGGGLMLVLAGTATLLLVGGFLVAAFLWPGFLRSKGGMSANV